MFWALGGEGQRLPPYIGYQKYVSPKGYDFELFMSPKGIDFDHINVKQGVFFTLA